MTGSHEGNVRVWDLRHRGSQPLLLPGQKSPVFSVAVASDGRVAAGSLDGSARVWDLNQPTDEPVILRAQPPVHPLGSPNTIRALAFVAHDRLVTGSDDGAPRVWDLNRPADHPLVLPNQGTYFSGLAVAPDGRIVSAGGMATRSTGILSISRTRHSSLREIRAWLTPWPSYPMGGLPWAVSMARRGCGTCRISTEQPIVLQGHQGAIHSLAFTKDGRVVTGGSDGSVKVWHIDLDTLIKKAEHIAGRNLSNPEWQQFFGQEPYRRTFPDLPDGALVAQARHAHELDRADAPSGAKIIAPR